MQSYRDGYSLILNELDYEEGWNFRNDRDKEIIRDAAMFCIEDPGAGFCDRDGGAYQVIMGYLLPEVYGTDKARNIHMLSSWLPMAKNCTFEYIGRNDGQECVPYSEWSG